MIRKILTTYAARLDEYLARSHRQPEGVAEVGLIGSAGEQCPNKLVVSLVNLEREASFSRCLGSRSAMKVILWNWFPCPLRICTTSGRPWEDSITLRSSARFAD